MYEHIKFKNAINMRKANYDKFPSTKLTGMLVQGWDSIISMLKKKMDARKVLAVDLYTGVYEEEVLDAFSKEFSGRVMNVRDLMKPEKEIQSMYLQPIITQYFIDNKSEIWLLFLIAHSKR